MPSGGDADAEPAATPPKNRSRKPPSRKNSSGTSTVPSPEERRRSIAAKTSVLLHPQVTLTCYVPTHCVGAVIGRRGSTILQIQKYAQTVASSQSPVRVSVVNENETDVPYTYSELDRSSPLWTPVVIRAEPLSALSAASRLEEIVLADVTDENPDPYIDEVVLDVPLSCQKHAAVVGKKGLVLANLSANTNVRIMVPRKDLQHDIIQLEGALENVSRCFEQILQLLATLDVKKKKQLASERSPTSDEVGRLAVGSLPSQSKLRHIAQNTDTVIQKKKIDEGRWELLVTGSQVPSAIALLEQLVEEKGNNSGNKDGGGDDTAPPASTSRPRSRTKPSGSRNSNKGRKAKGGGGAPRSSAIAPTVSDAGSS